MKSEVKVLWKAGKKMDTKAQLLLASRYVSSPWAANTRHKTNILWSCPKYLNRSLVSASACPSALGFPFASSAYLEAVLLSCFGGLAPRVVAGDFLLLLSLLPKPVTVISLALLHNFQPAKAV